MNKNKAIEKLNSLINDGQEILISEKSDSSLKFKNWHRSVVVSLENIFRSNPHTSHLEALEKIEFSLPAMMSLYRVGESSYVTKFSDGVEQVISVLSVAKSEVEDHWENVTEKITNDSAVEKIKLLIYRFHSVARQLTCRYSDRRTLTVDDEYDVQDLFHALLKLYFLDVRAEDSVPKHGGSSSRVDFLIKEENIVIEIKKTRNGLKTRQLGEQLIIDIERYQAHPNCNHLICFVYDPDNKIDNPTGIENDLSKNNTDRMLVSVFIEPK